MALYRYIKPCVRYKETQRIPPTEVWVPEKVIADMKLEGFVQANEDAFEGNGWDYDWAITFIKGDVKLLVTGNGYYGGGYMHYLEE